MRAVAPLGGAVRQLDRPAGPDEQVQQDDVTAPPRLVRLLMRILRDVALLRRRWWPPTIDHQDRPVDATGTTLYRFPHGIGGRVNWWPIRWVGAAGHQLSEDAASDLNTLVLVSHSAGTVTIRIEAAG